MKSVKILIILLITSLSYSSCTPEELIQDETEVRSTGDDTNEDIDDEKD